MFDEIDDRLDDIANEIYLHKQSIKELENQQKRLIKIKESLIEIRDNIDDNITYNSRIIESFD